MLGSDPIGPTLEHDWNREGEPSVEDGRSVQHWMCSECGAVIALPEPAEPADDPDPTLCPARAPWIGRGEKDARAELRWLHKQVEAARAALGGFHDDEQLAEAIRALIRERDSLRKAAEAAWAAANLLHRSPETLAREVQTLIEYRDKARVQATESFHELVSARRALGGKDTDPLPELLSGHIEGLVEQAQKAKKTARERANTLRRILRVLERIDPTWGQLEPLEGVKQLANTYRELNDAIAAAADDKDDE